ncbi:MAG: hypothetical protein IT370_07920 [Deltaproteobacteria bacterium]|nr:hypothetical protein [Deltaproteobacteria bacterium]
MSAPGDDGGATAAPDLAHLAELRAKIAARAVATALAGLVPLPIIDDLASEAARRSMLRMIAKARGIATTPGAIANLAVEVDAPTWRRLATGAAVGSMLWRSLRKAVLVLTVLREADEAARTFQIGTLFDHYCARMHPGGELDAVSARLLREVMTASMESVRREALKKTFRRGMLLALRTSARVPIKLVSSFVRAVTGRGKGEAAVDAAVEAAEREGFVAKAARAITDEITSSGSAFLGELVDAFGSRWKLHQALAKK